MNLSSLPAAQARKVAPLLCITTPPACMAPRASWLQLAHPTASDGAFAAPTCCAGAHEGGTVLLQRVPLLLSAVAVGPQALGPPCMGIGYMSQKRTAAPRCHKEPHRPPAIHDTSLRPQQRASPHRFLTARRGQARCSDIRQPPQRAAQEMQQTAAGQAHAPNRQRGPHAHRGGNFVRRGLVPGWLRSEGTR